MSSSTSKPAQALALFHQGYNCAQSVFGAFASECGLDQETALRMSSPFGAGIGRMREVCGAFCGASMVVGYKKGNASPHVDDKEKIFTLVQEMAKDFKREFGSLYCRDLLHLTSDSPVETPRPSERTEEYYKSRPCERCIQRCAQWADQYWK